MTERFFLRRPYPGRSLCQAGPVLLLAAVAAGALAPVPGAEVKKRYYAHSSLHDQHGVIAPWYQGQNGPCDFRLRIAAETLKRYPWVQPPLAVTAAPHYVFNGHWKISPDGAISPVPIKDWDNGDLGQRAAYVLSSMVDYYRYSGDPAAIAIMTIQADFLLDHCCTPSAHPWPGFLISVPIKGKPYGDCSPQGMIQLDIVAEVGVGLLRAYQVTGNTRWFEAAKHWGDLLAASRNRAPNTAPWGRYANPESAPWKDTQQTGGVVFLLYFFDELIRLGYVGTDQAIIQARDAGRAYLRDVLLPAWTVNDTWGRNYWDWNDPVQAENVTEFVARYLMDNPAVFPNWRNDVRNILSLFLNHTSVDPVGAGDVYSGAWAFPESNSCCGRSLWYGPMELAVPFAQYGVQAHSAWGRELARRIQILATYDGHDTGVSEDNLDGGFVVNADWFKIAHPMALKHLLGTIAWLPEEFGPARENHIVRSSAVVSEVTYGRHEVSYTTFDAPAPTIDLLRMAYLPERISGPSEQVLTRRDDLGGNGYTVKPLSPGDYLVGIRHDGIRAIAVSGKNPEHSLWRRELARTGQWVTEDPASSGLHAFYTEEPGATATITFKGNRVRLLGQARSDGGLAEIELDGVKQRVGIDCWQPPLDTIARPGGVLYERNGLANTAHTLKIVAIGTKNPLSRGTRVYLDGAAWSNSEGCSGFGAGGGPTETQRMIFGFPGREDYRDSTGNLWRPGTEFVVRLGAGADSVANTWWTQPATGPIADTADPDLYRHGIHAREFVVNVTVGPGKYHARMKFAATRLPDPAHSSITIAINGKEVVQKMDVAATAGGPNRAIDLVFNDLEPRNGVIDIRFSGGGTNHGTDSHAFVQAIEVGPGPGGSGATPARAAATSR